MAEAGRREEEEEEKRKEEIKRLKAERDKEAARLAAADEVQSRAIHKTLRALITPPRAARRQKATMPRARCNSL